MKAAAAAKSERGAEKTTKAATPQASPEAWVEQFTEGWREANGPDATAAFFERILDPGIRLIQPQMPGLVGLEEFRSGFIAPIFTMIPDLHGEVERWAARGDVVFIELTLHGTLGGRPISFRACDRITLRDGLAIERESYTDPLQLMAAALRRP